MNPTPTHTGEVFIGATNRALPHVIGHLAATLLEGRKNPEKNPYAKKLKKQISINIDGSVIDYFKQQANETGIPYQTLINLYLADCVEKRRS